MGLVKIYFIIILCVGFLAVPAYTETITGPDQSLSCALFNQPDQSNGQNSVRVSISSLYNFFKFTKFNDTYKASFTVDIILQQVDNDSQNTESRSFQLQTGTYGETTALDRLWTQNFQFTVPPGQYRLTLHIEGNIKDAPYHLEKVIDIQPFYGEAAVVTDLMFYSGHLSGVTDSTVIFPNVETLVIPADERLRAGFVTYQTIPLSHGEVTWSIAPLYNSDSIISSESAPHQTDRSAQHHSILISPERFNSGKFRLIYGIKTTEKSVQKTVDFGLLWKNLPRDLRSSFDRIMPMRHIMQPTEWDSLFTHAGALRDSLYEVWWDARDPDPDEPDNKLREEFYYRVDEASVQFTNANSRGWETDRGRIWILYGPPSERRQRYHEFNTPPYEVWIYGSIQRRFTFLDRNRENRFILVAENDEF